MFWFIISNLGTQETNRLDSELRLLKDKQQQLANILEDKQKNLQSLHTQDEMKNSDLEDLVRRKQEVQFSCSFFILFLNRIWKRFEFQVHGWTANETTSY